MKSPILYKITFHFGLDLKLGLHLLFFLSGLTLIGASCNSLHFRCRLMLFSKAATVAQHSSKSSLRPLLWYADFFFQLKSSVADPDPPGSTSFGRIRIHLDSRSGSGSTIPKCGSQDPYPVPDLRQMRWIRCATLLKRERRLKEFKF